MTSFLEKIGGFQSDIGAEIVAHDPENQLLFVVSGGTEIQILNFADPTNPTLAAVVDLADLGLPIAGINSVAYSNGLVALAIAADPATDPGAVAVVNLDLLPAAGGNLLDAVKTFQVGALPDMVTFTPDGSKVLVANEGEPGDTVDPEGSVSIIDVSGDFANLSQANVATADFTAFNGREADLRADGVRIFPDTPAANDFEPEYIGVSPDGTTAFVTLQENNAVAIVNIESATVLGVAPLGVKDFSKGEPELTTYDIVDRGAIANGGDPLVTATGETIELGGFSGLFFDGVAENGNLKFLTLPDRGPNGDPVDGNRPFLLPGYQARVISLEVNQSTGEVSITNQLLLTRPDGTPITGLPNVPNIDERAVDAAGEFVDLPYLDGFDEFGTDYDPLGADMEGIVRAPDGSFWMVDEYRPAIYHFGEDGVLIDRFVPQGITDLANAANPGANFAQGTFGSETLPAEYNNRRANRGFEGMALDTDAGILYAFIQTPLNNPNSATGSSSSVIRMLGIDPSTGEPVAEYVYLLQKPDVGNNVDKIGDAVYAGDGKFYVVERDSSTDPTAQKFVFEVSLTGATNVLGLDLGSETLEQQTPDDLEALGIQSVNKIKVTNLPSLGYEPTDKSEGLAYLPDGRLAVINDNDFGIVPELSAEQLGIIDFPAGNTLDASDEDGGINLQNWPVYGLKMPDGIATYNVNGINYFVIANEGDDRGEDVRVEDIVLDPTAFPNAAELQLPENLGRLSVSSIDGDLDGDGDYDQLFSYGGRGFSIYDELGNLVYDSGDDFETITAAQVPDLFNSNGEADSFDSRSDNKGPEAENVTLGQIGDTTYAYIGLERTGGVMVYDVTDPTAPQFVQYAPNPGGDVSPEGLTFIDGTDSPTGRPLLLTANEVSNTLTVYDVGSGVIQGSGDADELVGDASDNLISALAGDDVAAGELGNDAIFGGDGDDVLRGDRNARDAQVGEAGGDDLIYGGAGNDRIGGKSGNDVLFGDAGDDQIWGDDGDDILRGGLGNDTLTGDNNSGGQGSDVFVLAVGEGTDTITDFEVGIDFIGLAGGLSFGQLAFSGNAIAAAGEVLASLTGVDTTTLTADSFVTL